MYTINSARENREISWLLSADGAEEPQREGQGRNPEMNGHEKSYERIVPTKPGNKTATAEADLAAGRRSTAEIPRPRIAYRTQRRGNHSRVLQHERDAAT